MQACLTRLVLDRTYRRLFTLDAEAALEEYLLTGREALALRELDRTDLETFAELRRDVRRRLLGIDFPLLFGLDSPAVAFYFERYHALFPLRPGESAPRRAAEFGAYLEQCLEVDPEVPFYYEEIARYERLLCAARFAPEARRGEGNATAELSLAARPVLSVGAHLGIFSCAIMGLVERLQRGERPDADTVDRVEQTLIFLHAPESTSARILSANAGTHAVLAWCDGSTPISMIVRLVEDALGQTGLGAVILSVLTALSRRGVIEV